MSEDASWTWRPRTDCRQRTHRGSLSMPGALWPMERTLRICFGAPRPTWTRFSRAPSPPTCPSSSPPSSSWSSTSDRQSARPDDPAVATSSSRSGDRVVQRRAFLNAAMALLAAPLAAEAQQAAKVARIGWLGTQSAGGPHLLAAFRRGLLELGYVEGRNVLIEYRYSAGKAEQLAALAAELVALKLDVIV